MTKDIATAAMLAVAAVVIIVAPKLSPLREDDAKQRLDVIAESTAESVELLRETNEMLKAIARHRGDRWATLTSED